jgi:hypothetical protein
MSWFLSLLPGFGQSAFSGCLALADGFRGHGFLDAFTHASQGYGIGVFRGHGFIISVMFSTSIRTQ